MQLIGNEGQKKKKLSIWKGQHNWRGILTGMNHERCSGGHYYDFDVYICGMPQMKLLISEILEIYLRCCHYFCRLYAQYDYFWTIQVTSR